jgi:hypothetical protein
MNHKDEMLNLINRLSEAHECRTGFVAESKSETGRLLDAFQKRQDETRHELETNAHNMRSTMMMEEKQRLKESAEFKDMLADEQKERSSNARERMNNVNQMMSDFNGDRMSLKEELNQKAEELCKHLAQTEKNRLEESKQFQDLLDAETTERMNLTSDRRKDVGCLMGSFAASQAQVHSELMDSFAEALSTRQGWADDRSEIKTAWMNMTMHRASAPLSGAMLQHFHRQEKKEPPTEQQGERRSQENPATSETQQEERHENEEQPAADNLLTVKATLATFSEGCRFNELHRNMEGMSKSQLRTCLAYLLKVHELRRDVDDRYHLT